MMHSGSFWDLPAPPPGCSGWPWEVPEEVRMPDDAETRNWPRITIVTPSFQQARYLEQTIRSVLLQGYPDLEYMVIDGGSTDSSVDIIRRYERWLAYWVSEPDRGQAHAINKGFQRASGEILTWLNSDDVLEPGALFHVARAFLRDPEVRVVIGACRFVDVEGRTVFTKPPRYIEAGQLLLGGMVPGQPAVFFHRSVVTQVGFLDERFHHSLDREFWIRMGLHVTPDAMVCLDRVLARARVWEQSKTVRGGENLLRERKEVLDKYFRDAGLPEELRRLRPRAYARYYLRTARAHAAAGRRFRVVGDLWHAFCSSPAEFLRFLAERIRSGGQRMAGPES